jgi:voltage-gated potassium channel
LQVQPSKRGVTPLLRFQGDARMLPDRGIESRLASSKARKAIRGISLLFIVVGIGTLGYRLIEGWSLLDSLYMTVITITTVGFREVGEVSAAGRVFTIFIIFLGFGIIAYTLGMAAQIMVEFQVRSILGRRKLGMKIRSMKDHYVICGYGRIGSVISQELLANKIPHVVVENNPNSKDILEPLGIPYLIDDATNEDVLIEAGVERAKGLVAVLPSDADNVFITMSGRGLNPGLFILARAEEEKTFKKLTRAGANRVAMPHIIGGQKMAHTLINPAVADFVDLTLYKKEMALELQELRVGEQSRFDGVRLVDSGIRKQLNIIVVAITRKEGETVFNPSSETRIEAGDRLIALGKGVDLKKLSDMLSGQ